MPINPRLKSLYPREWPEISKRIRFDRARGLCERCGAPHNWLRSRDGFFLVAHSDFVPEGEIFSRIILTTAHLDHDPTNNEESNLAALCQRCHLAHDLRHHLRSRRENLELRSGQGRLFERE